MATSQFYTTERDRKLVVLGLPWDADTDDLRQHMSKFGELDDVIVMKDRLTGQSRGFGYVTFASTQVARRATAAQHVLNGRTLEVKVATPKEEMRSSSFRTVSRIFVARIPLSVTDEKFRSYFAKYGAITDAYMPKDQGSRAHRGIGFVTFENADSVDKLMNETHELGGSIVAVDRATPKEETLKFWGKALSDGYGVYNAYASAAAQFGTFGAGGSGTYNYSSSGFSTQMETTGLNNSDVTENPCVTEGDSSSLPVLGHTSSIGLSSSSGHISGAPTAPATVVARKIFVGRLPMEATAEHLRTYFSKFGRILDVYVPKDAKKKNHRGFGFVTFFDDGVAEQVALESHEILGQSVAVDRPTPQDDGSGNAQWMSNVPAVPSALVGGAGPPFQDSAHALPGMGYGSFQGNVSTGGAGPPLQDGTYAMPGFGYGGVQGSISTGVAGLSHDGIHGMPAVSYGNLQGNAMAAGAGSHFQDITAAMPGMGYGSLQGTVDQGNADETLNFWGKSLSDSYGMYNAYINAASQFGTFGGGSMGDYSYVGSGFSGNIGATELSNSNVAGNSCATNVEMVGGSLSPAAGQTSSVGFTTNFGATTSSQATHATVAGNKIFIGRLPMEATAEHLRTYFSRFGRILDVYVPKDAEKKSHRGFGFVTFFDDGVAERVALESHEILGQSIAVDRPTPQDDSGTNMLSKRNVSAPPTQIGGAGPPSQVTPMPGMGYGSIQGVDQSNGWGSYSVGGIGPLPSGGSRGDFRYRPY